MNRLKELREEKELTLRELADKVNLDKSTLSRFENYEREPSSSTLVELANYFDVSIDYLLGRSEIENADKVITEFIETVHPRIKVIEKSLVQIRDCVELNPLSLDIFSESLELPKQVNKFLLETIKLYKKQFKED